MSRTFDPNTYALKASLLYALDFMQINLPASKKEAWHRYQGNMTIDDDAVQSLTMEKLAMKLDNGLLARGDIRRLVSLWTQTMQLMAPDAPALPGEGDRLFDLHGEDE